MYNLLKYKVKTSKFHEIDFIFKTIFAHKILTLKPIKLAGIFTLVLLEIQIIFALKLSPF